MEAEIAFSRRGYLKLKFLSFLLITFCPSNTTFDPSPNRIFRTAPGTGSKLGLLRHLPKVLEKSFINTGFGATALNTPENFLSTNALVTKALVNKKYSGVFNAVAPKPVLMKDFSQTLGKCLNRPNLLPVPGAVLKILLGDGAIVVLEGQKVISSKLKNFNFKYPLLEKALYASTKN